MTIELPLACKGLPELIRRRLRKTLRNLSETKWFFGSREPKKSEQLAESAAKRYLTLLLSDKNAASVFDIEWVEGDWAVADALEKKRNLEYFNLWNQAGAAACRVAERQRRARAYHAIWKTASEVVPLPTTPGRNNGMDGYDGVQIMANYAARMVIDDVTDEPNINEPLVELYQMGLWPRGIVEKSFILFAPASKAKHSAAVLRRYERIADHSIHSILSELASLTRGVPRRDKPAEETAAQSFLKGSGVSSGDIDRPRRQVAKTEKHPVFISYRHESQELKKWVEALARRLRRNGIYPVLDEWQVKPGDSFTQYMEEGITSCRCAIFVCSPDSVARANSRSGGVGSEADLLATLGIEGKITTIPVLRTTSKVPSFLKGKRYVDLRGEGQSIPNGPFRELVRAIRGDA